MLDALLGELGFRALLIIMDATCNVMHRVTPRLSRPGRSHPLAFIGTFLLGIEDAHYRLVLTSTAPDAGETEDMQCLQERLNQVRTSSPEGPSQPAAQPAKPAAEMAVDVAVARGKTKEAYGAQGTDQCSGRRPPSQDGGGHRAMLAPSSRLQGPA